MQIAAVITQLKTYGAVFNHDGGAQVAGAAEWAAAEGQSYLPDPAAYVVPLEESAGPNLDLNGLQQEVEERIGVVVTFDNRPDRRGQTVAEEFAIVRAAIFKALLNWRPDPTRYARGFRYGSGGVLSIDRRRLVYRWDFVADATITEADGWTDPTEPLRELQADTLGQTSGAPFGPGFDIQNSGS